MTNTNNTAAAIAAEIIATAETRIELRAAELHDVDCFRQLCASAVAWLDAEYFGQADDDEEHADEYRDPLSFEVYRNGHTGEYIADLDLAVGGPTIRARYESRWGELTITAAWGADRVEMSARAQRKAYSPAPRAFLCAVTRDCIRRPALHFHFFGRLYRES